MSSSFGVSAFAQNSSCQSTLAYLANPLPTTGYQPLDSLRSQILTTSVIDAMAKMKAQGMSLDQGIDLATRQADADEANLLTIERAIRGSVQAGHADSLMRGLKARNYSEAGFQEDVLGASERAYVANDWGALANRETAKQFRCFRFGQSYPTAQQPDSQVRGSVGSSSSSQPTLPGSHKIVGTLPRSTATLDETLRFIQEKITAIGKISFSDPSEGLVTQEISSVTPDVAGCTLRYTIKTAGINKKKSKVVVPLGSVDSSDDAFEPDHARLVLKSERESWVINFKDGEISMRVADAFVRARELCAKPKKPEPF
jgi:hypothetical protein